MWNTNGGGRRLRANPKKKFEENQE